MPRIPLLGAIAVSLLSSGCSDGAAPRVAGSDTGLPPTTTVVRVGDDFHIGLGPRQFAQFTTPTIGARKPHADTTRLADGWRRVRLTWDLDRAVQQDDLAIVLDVSLQPDFQWLPHLTPIDGSVAAQHVFRSPAIIVAEGAQTLVIVPDLEICGTRPDCPWYIDYDAPHRRAAIGMSKTSIPVNVLYRKVPGMTLGRGTVELGFYVKAYVDHQLPRNPWGEAAKFLWTRFAQPLARAGEPHRVPMGRYVKQAYRWAFETWERTLWQQFSLGGTAVGAPQNLVFAYESPNYPGRFVRPIGREIWNNAWFSSLRSAAGLYRWGRWTGEDRPIARASLTKALALAAPMNHGIFPAVFRVGDRSDRGSADAGWPMDYWTNSDRCPWELGVTRDWYHVADASWTALQMLRWYRELEPDPRLLRYAVAYADELLTLQNARDFFPDWLHPTTLAPANVLPDSPETSVSVTFLLELAAATGDARYRTAAWKAMDAVLAGPVPIGRWEDFETYWSNNSIGTATHIGRRFARNGMFKQNTLSMFWTAEALLRTYEATGNAKYLAWGRRTLDELSMVQQVWQPPFMHVPTLGGFGVMNADGEWNDARQSLFAELFMDYYTATGDPILFERGTAALKASFAMMYSPLNPMTRVQWQRAHPFLGAKDYGFMMENYGHDGSADARGGGIGMFAIYDWGAGAASEAFTRIVDHYGHVYLDRARGRGFGIDSVSVSHAGGRFTLVDRAGQARFVRVVFADGEQRLVWLAGPVTL